MHVHGIIFTAIDTDADNIESWNRWYDLEHLPPNIALPEIKHGRRYVAPPELHDVRLPADPHPGFEGGKGVNVTIYLTAADPSDAIASMTAEREVLVAAGRMDNAGNRAVRAGDAMAFGWASADPSLKIPDTEVPFLAHRAIRVVLRRGGTADARDRVAAAAVAVPGVVGVMSFDSRFFDGLSADIYLFEGDSAATTEALRAGAPYGDEAAVVLDAPFDEIVPFDYSFAERIRNSWLPQVLDTDQVL